MSRLKQLAGQTAIYGLSSILGRFLNYLLVPLYTGQFVPAEYGVINDVYAIVAFIAVILPWGMETAYFRYAHKDGYSPREVLATSLFFVLFSSLLFAVVILTFTDSLAVLLRYPQHPEYVLWMGLALTFDALSAIPFARLRNDNRPAKFASVNITSILINIGLNLFFIGYCMPQYEAGNTGFFIENFYDPTIGVGYVFVSNMVASGVKFVLLSPAYAALRYKVNFSLLGQLLRYATPLVVAGFAGIVNETLDRRLIRILLEGRIGTEAALAQVGIYGAVYKLSIIITLFIQAFRYAAEPFFFARSRDEDSRQVYADVMKWFTVMSAFIFLLVMQYLDVFKYFIRTEAYWTGLYIVPILLLANVFLGWIYNLSVWYKMTHKTIYGALIAVVGAVITIVLNIYLIPRLGYEGAAWTTFTAYGSMAVLSYLLGRKFFPVPYNLKKISGYVLFAVALWYLGGLITPENVWLKYLWKTFIILVFAITVLLLELKDIIEKRIRTK